MKVFLTLKRPAKHSSFAGMPFKNLLVFEPYKVDGTGPYLVHVFITFVRPTGNKKRAKDEVAHKLKTSFAVRGRPNWVNP